MKIRAIVYPDAALRGVCAGIGEAAFRDEVTDRVREAATRFGETVEECLNRHGIKGKFYNARKDLNFKSLAECFRELGISIEVAWSRIPWDNWSPDSTVLIVVGERPRPPTGEDAEFDRPQISRRDAEAMMKVVNMSGRRLGIDCRPEVRGVSMGVSQAEAAAQLERWRARKDVGAIVVLGSDVANPMADTIARAIADDYLAQKGGLPARFRWSKEPPPSVLSWGGGWKSKDVGIWVDGPGARAAGRTLDREIRGRRERGDKGPFDECGLLMVDARTRPVLILAAGHGGLGTLACVEVLLGSYEEVAARLLTSRSPEKRDSLPMFIGENRLFEIIEAKVVKDSSVPVEDMEIESADFRFEDATDEDDEDDS